MTRLIIMRGLPASGKTTWAKDWVALDPHNRARVNRDDLRAMVHDGFYGGHGTERRILKARDVLIASFLHAGLDVVIDDTNLPSGTVRDLMKLAAAAGAEVEIKDFTDVSLTTCIHRDEKRYDGANPRACVGKGVIMDMHERYIKGKSYPLSVPELTPKTAQEVEPYVAKPGTPKAVLVDIDGTVALLRRSDCPVH
jgi:predicted kinase